jgi:hypothetical protein
VGATIPLPDGHAVDGESTKDGGSMIRSLGFLGVRSSAFAA